MTKVEVARPPVSLLSAVAAMALLRGFIAAATDLSDDEAYYRLWALAPALSYLDHPPMVAWMIAAGRELVGDNPLGIRLATVLTGLLGPILLWRTVCILFDASVAARAVWFALAMPLLAVGGIIMTPDTPSVLFWGLTGWATAELYVSRNPNWWLAIGLFAGLGLLSKYTNLFVGAGILLWLISARTNWQWFRSWQLWVGGLLAALLTLPVMIWNANHGWASFHKQFGRVVRDQTFVPFYLLEFIGSFVGLASPIIAVLALAGLWHVMASCVRRPDQPGVLLAASVLPLLLYFFVHALHARVQPHWIAPLYPSLAACAALAANAHWLHRGIDRVPSVVSWALATGLAMSALLCLHAIHPIVLWPAAKDPSSQLRGWKQFAKDIDRLRMATGACWVATSHYAITGQLAYHLPSRAPVVQVTEPIRYAHLPAVGGDILRCRALHVELARRALPAEVAARFGSVLPIGTLTRHYQGQAIAAYNIALLSDPLAPVAARSGPVPP